MAALTEKAFRDYLFSACGYTEGKTVLAAVSGGVDSVVLVNLLQRCEIPFAIAHVNYGLRGKESDEDEKFAADLAKKTSVPFYLLRCDENVFTTPGKNSIQSAARKIRYDFFETTAAQHGFLHIATAHHFDDSVETALLNFARGTGIEGLKGIRAVNGKIIRPLLFTTRKEIHRYAVEKKLAWREDSSNAGDKYTRNRLRHHVLPELMDEIPQGAEGFAATFARLEEISVLRDFALKEWKNKCVNVSSSGEEFILVPGLRSFTEPLAFLAAYLRQYNFTSAQLGDVGKFLMSSPGSALDSASHRLIMDRARIFITRIPVAENEGDQHFLYSDDFLEVRSISAPSSLQADDRTAFLDADCTELPLHMRRWQPGDSFIPFGMKGRKKISDILNELKIPAHLKKNYPVVLSGNEIAWVPGYRIAEKFRVREKTISVLHLTFHHDKYFTVNTAV